MKSALNIVTSRLLLLAAPRFSTAYCWSASPSAGQASARPHDYPPGAGSSDLHCLGGARPRALNAASPPLTFRLLRPARSDYHAQEARYSDMDLARVRHQDLFKELRRAGSPAFDLARRERIERAFNHLCTTVQAQPSSDAS